MERLRLEWVKNERRGDMAQRWEARVLGVALTVDEFPAGYYWTAGTDDDEPDEWHATTLLAAQFVAEAAALTLLTEAVASFGVEPPGWALVAARYDGYVNITPLSARKPVMSMRPADATRLACALLAAARKEG